jgi:hypothetical protein
MFHRIAIWRVFVTLDFSTFSTKSAESGPQQTAQFDPTLVQCMT